jgi:hypothetical protein
MEERPNIPSRAGNFFLVIGVALIFLFIISDMYGFFTVWYFFCGAGVLALGGVLKFAARGEQKPSERFHGIRKVMARDKSKDKKKK